ncbi:hypothetical protein D8674_007350 [Pyrus ussuriensis x Pyrus communis]|uniref:Uncharacterized protein n=1 Tax=Pyrus ussuriensis x Pyrus communis TaxID=2448454 RepID=A0A5N5HUA8_9ROSA|nr:hypothetical protein D8674_007350 [Pyrus ussuriensis x Pyrus communis]
MDSVHKEFKWDFFNLERAFEEKVKLNHEVIGNNDKVYLFGTIECHFQRKDEVVVPVLVAVVSPSPPSYELRIKPVNGAEIRKDSATQMVKYPQIFVLGCTERRSDASNCTKDESFVKLQYFFPCLDDNEEEEDDYEELSPVVKAGLKEYVEDMIFDAKRNHGETKDSSSSVFSFIQAILGGRCKCKHPGTNTLKRLSREEGFGNRRMYKFYTVQTPETPDISKAKYRCNSIKYYGTALEVL